MVTRNGARPVRACEVVVFDETTDIRPTDVVYVDNREKLQLYHSKLEAFRDKRLSERRIIRETFAKKGRLPQWLERVFMSPVAMGVVFVLLYAVSVILVVTGLQSVFAGMGWNVPVSTCGGKGAILGIVFLLITTLLLMQLIIWRRRVTRRSELADIDSLCKMIDTGLDRGLFIDTQKVAEWVGKVNEWAGLPDLDLPPMRLVVVHAETHIGLLRHQIVSLMRKPAACIFGGSKLMITDFFERPDDPIESCTNPMVKEVLLLQQRLLTDDVPILGICFGMHQLLKAAYNILPKWLRVPQGMLHEHHARVGSLSFRLTGGTRRMVFGSRKVTRKRRDPIMHGVDRKIALKVHSQGYMQDHPGLPRESILAVCNRHWLAATPGPGSKHHHERTFIERIVEVVRVGETHAYATQCHPEMRAYFLLMLLELPEFQDAARAEGYDIEVLRAELEKHPRTGHWAGRRLGYNFIKRIVFEQLVRRLVDNEVITASQAEVLGRRVWERDASIPF